jgi:hypothetical protein
MSTTIGKVSTGVFSLVCVAIFAGGVLTPTIPCACDPDPEGVFLLLLNVAAKGDQPGSHGPRLSRSAVLEAVPIGTTKQDLTRIIADIEKVNGRRLTNPRCDWNSNGDVYACNANLGKSWFNIIKNRILVEFEFDDALQLEQVHVTAHDSILWKEYTREI